MARFTIIRERAYGKQDVYTGDSLEDLAEFLEMKTGRSIATDGGETEADDGS